MAITASDNSISKQSIPTCKQTYIVAKGTATAANANLTKSVKEAIDEAKAQRELAYADAKALKCPQDCGSGRYCKDNKTTTTGSSLDRSIPVKDKATGLYSCNAWATYSVYRHCLCVSLE